jgi:serine phosphatase RsbU (regulator of sigma subunit)/CHASE3 domain sensor protein
MSALFVSTVLLSVVLAYFALTAVLERNASIDQLQGFYQPSLRMLSDLQYALVDQETAVRAFVITADERFLEPYERGRTDLEEVEARLLSTLEQDDALMAGARRMTTAVDRWQTEVAEPEVAATRAGGPGAAERLVSAALGERLFDQAREELRTLRGSLEVQEALAVERFEEARDRVTFVLFSTVGLTALSGMVGASLITRWITQPLTRLIEGVKRVTAGALHEPVEAGGPVDIAALGRDIDSMRQRIVRDLELAVAAREALAQQAPAVLLLREQLQPSPRPDDGIEMAATFQPAEGVLAGDWYDLIDLGGGRVALAVVDVSGHGPRAGGLALQAKHLLTAALRDGKDPAQALGYLAGHLEDTGEAFLTAFLATIDTASGLGEYANAGHPPALLLSEDGVIACEPTGPLLGPLPGFWVGRQILLAPGDVLVAYTDGLIEARSEDGDEFGFTRLREVFLSMRGSPPDAVVEACTAAVRAFRTRRLDDDLTIVAAGLPAPDEG